MKDEYLRLLTPKDLGTMIESYKYITDASFYILHNHGKKEKFSNSWDFDANLLFQMTITKCLSILQLSESITYANNIDLIAISIYDPFSIYNLVRAQYEAFCNFNNIYIQSKSLDEIKLKYFLWVVSGLNYRQRFKVFSKEAVAKQQEEKKEIEYIIKEIENNKCFLELEEQSKKNIYEGIKKRDWQFIINGNKAYKIAWHDMMTNAGTNDLLEGQYSFLSLNTHPSNVSVFQFGNMYSQGEEQNFTRMAVQISKILTSLLIRDYCFYFQSCISEFNNIPKTHQMLINSYNRMFRNPGFALTN